MLTGKGKKLLEIQYNYICNSYASMADNEEMREIGRQ